MKTFARVKFHEGFMKALMDKEFSNLRMYCEEWLSNIKGQKVFIRVPQKGDKKSLICYNIFRGDADD